MFAVKMPLENKPIKKFIDSARNEFFAMRNIKHPNIIRVYQYNQGTAIKQVEPNERVPFLVYEAAQMGDLQECLKKCRILPE